MELTPLLSHLAGLRLIRQELLQEELVIEAAVSSPDAPCPACLQPSQQIHSRSIRRIADHPLGHRRTTLLLHTRRFRCRNARCPRQTFTERLPHLVAPYARRTTPLQTLLQDIGVTLGGRPGARFAQRQGIPVSRTTLLRGVRRLPDPPFAPPTVLGVDDFALRRGHHYGTILVDLQTRRVIDLLPDRTANTLTAWLTARPRPEIICRDRAGAYAEGARQGAPQAVQIADRFHLMKNSSDLLERLLSRHPTARRTAVAREPRAEEAHSTATAAPPSNLPLPPALVQSAPVAAPGRQQERFAEVVRLRQQGWSITAISERIGLSRPTVRKYLRHDTFPQRSARRTLLSAGTVHGAYLEERWAEGCQDAVVLCRELQERGFGGTVRMVQRAVAGWRQGPRLRSRMMPGAGTPPPQERARLRPPSARQAVWLLLRPREELTAPQQEMCTRMLETAPEIQTVLTLIEGFRQMVQHRDGTTLEGWLQTAQASQAAELRTFTAGLRRDQAAVEAALGSAWSSGQVEGQVTKTKLIKRQMYGRAKFDLLRKRVLLAS